MPPKAIGFDFLTKTLDFEASNLQTLHEKHVVTYGGNLRFNTFDLSLAPKAENRTEGGGYIQDESLWACRTCGACVQACPVMIEHVPSIGGDDRQAVLWDTPLRFYGLEDRFAPTDG